MNTFPYVQKEEEYGPEQAQREMVELLIKAARRCAYDLKHAASSLTVAGTIGNRNEGTMYGNRADMWLRIFDPVEGPKDYRHRLHMTIAQKQDQIEKLVELCKKHGIDTSYIVEECPF